MKELVRTFGLENESCSQRFLEVAVQFLLRVLVDHRQESDVGGVAQTGELPQGVLGVGRQAAQLADHEVDHVVGVSLGVNARQVPGPARRPVIEADQSFLDQRRQKLDREEWIAGRLLVHQLRQRGRALMVAVERIRNQPAQIFAAEGRKENLLDERSGFADRLEFAHQWVGRRDFVVPIGADQQKMLHLRLGHQVFEEIERGRVEPLQVVQEQGERMLGPGEHAKEPSEDQFEAALRGLGRKLRDRRLLANDELEFGEQIDHQLAVRTQRLPERIAPAAEFRFALREERTDQTLKGLGEGGIRDIAFVLVELARGEQAARRHQHLVELIYDGRLADPGIAGDEYQLRCAALDDVLKGGEQGRDLTRPPVQFLGD